MDTQLNEKKKKKITKKATLGLGGFACDNSDMHVRDTKV